MLIPFRLPYGKLALLSVFTATVSFGQHDPGVRQGAPGAGAPLQGLTTTEKLLFDEGVQRATQLEAVCDECADLILGHHTDPASANLVTLTNSAGLGARFNGDQCTVCHNQPALGGLADLWCPIRRTSRTSSGSLRIRCSI